MSDPQISMYDIGINDQFNCAACAWMRTYGHCYPADNLCRQYFYETGCGRRCSDYCTAFASMPGSPKDE